MADKSEVIATKTIFHPTITDIPANDINIFIRNKINMTWQSLLGFRPTFQQIKKDRKVALSPGFQQTTRSHSNQSENWTFFFDPFILNQLRSTTYM